VTTSDIFYAIEWMVYLAILFAVAVTLRGIRRELKRVADRLEDMADGPE
jgi:hypothetical protein